MKRKMKNHNSHGSWMIVFLFTTILHISVSIAQRQAYVVHVERHVGERTLFEIEDKHFSYLTSVKKSAEEAKSSLLYSYKHVMNGFSALLTPDEAHKLSEMNGVVSVKKSNPRSYSIQTTRSWEFTDGLGGGNNSGIFDNELLQNTNYGKDVIVGVIDTGVWPDSESFNDEGMGPVPQSWKGTCQPGVAFNSSHCNRKLIGARYYLKGYEAYYGTLNETLEFRSARDRDGHGTHTASTVAGREVSYASNLGGFANGTAAGGAPLARLAIYKVCWATPEQSAVFESRCPYEDILAAFDDAIADGVHVISISIVPDENIPYNEDGLALGALHAAKRGIVVVAAGGNSGPAPSTVRNVAPWIITVAASSIDRVFSSPVLLGNGHLIQGQTVTPYKLANRMYPLVYAGDVENPGTTNNSTTGHCIEGSLSPELVRGKIVLCLSWYGYNVQKGLEVKRAGGVAFILQNPVDGISIAVDTHVLPGTVIYSNDSATILDYIKSNVNATARIVPVRTVLGSKPSPIMAGFSAVGPNTIEPHILKPDIAAPGLNILAAWSEASSPTKLFADDRVVKYNIISGTSMACPHVAAAAALLKAAHPDWSAAAIRSALMTTTTRTNNIGQPIADGTGNAAATPFNYGSGHLKPSTALNAGLVYDANYTDYLLPLCNNRSEVKILDSSFTCPDEFPSVRDLNYPSIAVSKINGSGVTVKRTVTNVGEGASVYRASVETPVGYTVEISPNSLKFSGAGEKQSFRVIIRPENGTTPTDYRFGWYTWSDGIHSVTSPIVISS